MEDYDLLNHVATIRPTFIPAPDAWLASLEPILDDDQAWCLLVDGRGLDLFNKTSSPPFAIEWELDEPNELGWGVPQRVRYWRKPMVLAIEGFLGSAGLTFMDAFDIVVISPSTVVGATGAEKARRWGHVFAVHEDAYGEAQRLARIVGSRAPYATQLAKEAIWRGYDMHLEQALRFETDLTLLLQTTKDRAEGVRAFMEKRRPNFTGS